MEAGFQLVAAGEVLRLTGGSKLPTRTVIERASGSKLPTRVVVVNRRGRCRLRTKAGVGGSVRAEASFQLAVGYEV